MNNRLIYEISKMMKRYPKYFSWYISWESKEFAERENKDMNFPDKSMTYREHILSCDFGLGDKAMRTSDTYQVAVDVFDETGCFMFIDDMWTYVGSPSYINHILPKLIEQYGKKDISLTIANIYNKNNMSLNCSIIKGNMWSDMYKEAHTLREKQCCVC